MSTPRRRRWVLSASCVNDHRLQVFLENILTRPIYVSLLNIWQNIFLSWIRECEGNTLRNPRVYCLHADRDVSWLSPRSFLEVERERECWIWACGHFRGRGGAASPSRDESRRPFCSCSRTYLSRPSPQDDPCLWVLCSCWLTGWQGWVPQTF